MRLIIILAFVVLAGCASGPNVITNAAPGFNLASYQTFSFLQPLSTDNGDVRTMVSNELITPTRRELEWIGLRYVESGGDLLVNFVVSTRETIQTRNTPSTGVSVRHGRYGTWGGYNMAMSTTEVIQRTEGTLGIDIIDAERRELVWEGAVSGRVTDKVLQNRAAALDGGVREILARFP
jgi:hypothetical protein